MNPPVFVIYCPELAERERVTRQHFAERGVTATWWRSIHGKSWHIETTAEFEPGQRISQGHCGLNLGHWTLWGHMSHVLPDDSYGIVFEDDAVLPKDFYPTVAGVVDELMGVMPDWDLVFLGSGDAGVRTWDKVILKDIPGREDRNFARLHDHPRRGRHAEAFLYEARQREGSGGRPNRTGVICGAAHTQRLLPTQ